MQKITPLYGLTVGCPPDQHIRYTKLADRLGRVCRKIEAAANASARNQTLTTGHVTITPGRYLTFAAEKGELRLGIYDSQAKPFLGTVSGIRSRTFRRSKSSNLRSAR